MPASPADTIFAVSSGAPPAAIAVLRISGAEAFAVARSLAGTLPEPRRAGLRRLRAGDGRHLDTALILGFPGPDTATGEDVVELHLHGGRAIVAAVEAELARRPELRGAEPGEFTRRALGNGRIDLAQAEGLADLLAAETEAQRRAAVDAAEGSVGRAVRRWTARVVALSARVEALIDFADEDDVPADPAALAAIRDDVAALAAEIAAVLANPPVERLRDGVRVVLAGPTNAGKSTLINALAERDVAIASPLPGTTRDRIEVPAVRAGLAYLLTDTAGLADTADTVEAIGIGLTHAAMAAADILLWLGDEPPPPGALWVQPRVDQLGRECRLAGQHVLLSAVTGEGIGELWHAIDRRARLLQPAPDRLIMNRRQRCHVETAAAALARIAGKDLLLLAEELRLARAALDRVTGAAQTEDMLDALFGQFCIGK